MISVQSQLSAFLASPLGRYRPYIDERGRCPQAEFHSAAEAHRYRVIRGGNRSGKTFAAAAELLYRLTGTSPYDSGARPFRPITAWVVVLDWEFGVGQVLWPTLQRLIDPDTVRTIRWYRKAEPAIPFAILFRCGSLLEFKSVDAGRRKFQGARIDYIWIDEEAPWEIVRECRMRLVDRAGSLVVTLTPVRGERWVRDLEAEPGTHVTRLSMRANPHIPPEVVAEELGAMTARERSLREQGDWVPVEGLIYPEFSERLHVVHLRGGRVEDDAGAVVAPWPLPAEWLRLCAIDFGFANPFCCVWAALEPGGSWWIYRVAHRSGVRATTWGTVIRQIEAEAHEAVTERWADHDRGDRADLAASGVETRPALKDVAEGLLVTSRLFVPREDGSPRLRIVVDEVPRTHPISGRLDGKALVDEIQDYRWSAADAKPEKDRDHATDALRYLAMGVATRSRRVRIEPPRAWRGVG